MTGELAPMEVIEVPGKKMKSIKRPKVYEKLRDKGYSKTKAAKIANSKRSRKR